MRVKKKLMRELEHFLNTFPAWDEQGGFLLNSNRSRNVDAFLPIPNISDTKKNNYRLPDSAYDLAKKYASSKRKSVVAFWHSHPTPLIMSSADVRASQYYQQFRNIVFVTIAPYGYREWVWTACIGVKPERVEEVD